MLALFARYDLSKWQFTDRVRIEDGVVPHSHPVLTLSTRHLDHDTLLLATYLHEELHWFVAQQRGAQRALNELRRVFPSVPVGTTEGAEDEVSSYLHYIVCYLEYDALIEILGPEEARRVIDFWCRDHYTEIYGAVLQEFDAISEIVSRHALIP